MKNDVAVDSSVENLKAKKWQFSLREIIFATAAVTAFIAIATQNQPRKTSLMARQFSPSVMVDEIVKKKSLKGQVYAVGGGGAILSQSQISKSLRIEIDGLSELEIEGVLMPALLAEIKTTITGEGHSITHEGASGSNGELKKISDFRLGYDGFRLSGYLRVFAEYDREGNTILVVTLDEN